MSLEFISNIRLNHYLKYAAYLSVMALVMIKSMNHEIKVTVTDKEVLGWLLCSSYPLSQVRYKSII